MKKTEWAEGGNDIEKGVKRKRNRGERHRKNICRDRGKEGEKERERLRKREIWSCNRGKRDRESGKRKRNGGGREREKKGDEREVKRE